MYNNLIIYIFIFLKIFIFISISGFLPFCFTFNHNRHSKFNTHHHHIKSKSLVIKERQEEEKEEEEEGQRQEEQEKNRIAVVRPFITKDANQLILDLRKWEKKEFLPCSLSKSTINITNKYAVDLVLYYAYNITTKKELQQSLLLISTLSKWRSCFSSVYILNCFLDETKDSYLDPEQPSGVVLQYYNLFEHSSFYLRYRYFLYMEPDTTPIRSGWLNRLIDECFLVTNSFWMKGSVYRGNKYVPKGEYKNFEYWMMHINGNAIFGVGDEEYRKFLGDVKETMGVRNPFDTSQYVYRYWRFNIHQDILDKFVYTSYIQNIGVAGYSMATMIHKYPETFLIHKKIGCKECDPILP